MAVATPTSAIETKPLPTRDDGNLFTGNLKDFVESGVDFMLDTGKIAPVVKCRFVFFRLYMVTDAEYAKQILVSNNRNYIKDQRMVKIIEAGGTPSLFSTDGDEWLWRRRLMQPAFHRRAIAGFADSIVDETNRMADQWQPGAVIDVDDAMKVLTMMVIGRTMFNVDMAGDSQELHDAYRLMAENLGARLRTPVNLPLWVPTKRNRQFHEVTTTVREALTTILESRLHEKKEHYDLLDMLLAARSEDENDEHNAFTPEQLLIEMSSIVFAGHETTATTLTWFFYFLSQHPDVEARVLAEIDEVLAGEAPNASNVQQLTYTKQVIQETLRFYPAAMGVTRDTVEPDQLGPYELPANANVMVNIIGMHHDPRYWENPDQFDPDHFLPERVANRPKFAFLPFLNGPRKCIGEPLARMEMELIVATLLQNYRLRMKPGTEIKATAVFALQPAERVLMTLEKRS